MNNNRADEAIREKIESLTTLQSGVVYGREDAWEKLQVRLEAKPVRKSTAWYWLAAAAILLIVVSITIMWIRPETNGIVKKENQPILKTVKDNNREPQTIAAPSTQSIATPETLVIKTIMPLKKPAIFVKNSPGTVALPVANYNPSPEVQVPLPAEAPVTATPVAVKKMAKPMRVIHINELENDAPEESLVNEIPKGNPSLVLALSKMPVVHINDVMKMEGEENRMRYEMNPPTYVIPFIKPFYANRKSLYEDAGPVSHNSLKITLRSPF